MASIRVAGLTTLTFGSLRAPRRSLSAVLAAAAFGLPMFALANEYEERVPAQAGGKLEVVLFTGSVEVEAHTALEVVAEARASGSGVEFALTGDGRDSRFEARDTRWVGLPFTSWPKVRVRLRVPESYSVSVQTNGGSVELVRLGGEVIARTSGGSIEVEQVQGVVDVKTSGGSIRLDKIRGNVAAETSGGSIRVAEVDGRLDVQTSGGSIRVDEAVGPVEARTSGGSISVTFASAPKGNLRTSGGSIEAEFPRASGVNLDARTSGGRVLVESAIKTTGSAERSRIEGEINGGGESLLLRTSGGNIRVRER
jgi:hypothetical protein